MNYAFMLLLRLFISTKYQRSLLIEIELHSPKKVAMKRIDSVETTTLFPYAIQDTNECQFESLCSI